MKSNVASLQAPSQQQIAVSPQVNNLSPQQIQRNQAQTILKGVVGKEFVYMQLWREVFKTLV